MDAFIQSVKHREFDDLAWSWLMTTIHNERVAYTRSPSYPVPATLEELTGPTTGTVTLPLRLAWSGRRSFELDNPVDLARMYKVVMEEGSIDDLRTYLNGASLRRHWPQIRPARAVRPLWVRAFPELEQVA